MQNEKFGSYQFFMAKFVFNIFKSMFVTIPGIEA
jgi:hypothetical protein